MGKTVSVSKVVALWLATFVVVTALTGGFYSHASLSESEDASASFSATGNISGNISSNISDKIGNSSGSLASADNQANDSLDSAEQQRNGSIIITLQTPDSESENQSVAVGEEIRYRVVVKDAANNVTAYNLRFALSNPGIATFENFTHTKTADTQKTTVTETTIDASAGVAEFNGIEGPEVYLGTIIVAGNTTGQTTLKAVDVDEGSVRVIDDRLEAYNLTSIDTRVLTVEQANATNATDNASK